MTVSVLLGLAGTPADVEYRRGRTLNGDEGVGTMAFLIVLVVAVAVVVLVMRTAGASGGPGSMGEHAARQPRPPRAARPSRPMAPDDDPEFLRELERRTKRDDGSPA